MGERRKGREVALQILYGIDVAPSHDPKEALNIFWSENPSVSAEAKAFIEQLVTGVCGNKDSIDEMIGQHSSNWKISRMAVVDRNILRLAIYELKWCADIPLRVTLNEAIEIAKQFGTEESGAFVNGILDKVAKSVNKE
jgi:N utilization substance protein B